MIDLVRLYEIAPEIAPKRYKRFRKFNKPRPASSNQKSPSLLANPLRENLLENIAVFRSRKLKSYSSHFYTCSSKNTIHSFRTSLDSSVLNYSPLKNPDFSTSSQAPDAKRAVKVDMLMKSELETDRKAYQKSLTGILKNTLPKFCKIREKRMKFLK